MELKSNKLFGLFSGLLVTAITVSPAQTLKTLATSRGINFGAAVTSGTRSAEYNRVLSTEFNAMVAENAMKMQSTEPTQGNFTFGTADALTTFAEQNSMKMRGHCLVWHSQAGWYATSTLSRVQMLAALKNHILTVAGRYRGRVYEWDVVNEAVDDNGSQLRQSFWIQRIGNDFIDSAFVWARQADPTAWLVYNDYGAEGMNAKSNYVYTLVSGLKSRGVPINGVGLQSHFTNTVDTANIARNMSRIEALGLNVSITELDIGIASTSQANLDAQKAAYKAYMTLCLRHPGCKTFITWGLNDAGSWRGAAVAPLLFTGTTTITPKPAYFGVQEALLAATGIRMENGRMKSVRALGYGPTAIRIGGAVFNTLGRKVPMDQ